MALLPDEIGPFFELHQQLGLCSTRDNLMNDYYEGEQRLQQLGLAVPPELRRFTTIVNWPALVVDSVAERIKLKGFILPGEVDTDEYLRQLMQANNFDSDQHLLWNDKLVYGRGFLAIGANEEDSEFPIITVESPREMAVKIDPRTRRVAYAAKLYGGTETDPTPNLATLYTPDATRWLERDSHGQWREYDRDDHRLGRVPVVPFFNRRRTGREGTSEMQRAISLTDAAARSLTNLQLAQETHAVPQRYALGLTKGDFIDASTGKPLPVWEAYFSSIWTTGNENATVGQFANSDLRNFSETVNFYGRLVAGQYGLPTSYTGQLSDNPASAEAIRESKERLLIRAEMHMSQDGDQLGRAVAIAQRIRTGEWPDGDRIQATWFDPATPTLASKADAVVKLKAEGILSREGSWDELDWSEARKARERRYFEDEAADPQTDRLIEALNSGDTEDAE